MSKAGKRKKEKRMYFRYKLYYMLQHLAIRLDVKIHNRMRVAFVVSSLTMWKSQQLVDLLMADPRFEVKIILSPFVTYSEKSQRSDMQALREYFRSRGIPFEDHDFDGAPYDMRGKFNPHVIFYTQPYRYNHCPEHDSGVFKDRFLAYIPYSFWPSNEEFGFDTVFHRLALRIYYANEMILDVARSISLVKAKNGRVAGYPSADLFTAPIHEDNWKIKDRGVKRIIWAPHYSVNDKTSPVHNSSFLEICEFMAQYTRTHVDTVQVAFKPHPRLKTELIQLWGEQRTLEYYAQWDAMHNAMLEEGSYADLFMTSDALIHDCGSFIVEYHYTCKPCLYVVRNFERIYNEMNALGRKALDLHYKGETAADIEQFIENVVREGNDPLLAQREEFYRSQLLPPNGKSTAMNIYEDLSRCLLRKR